MAKKANELKLSTDALVTWIEPKGKHIREAGRIFADEAENSMFVSMAIVTQVAEIDGEPLTMPILDDLPSADVLKIIGKVMGNGV